MLLAFHSKVWLGRLPTIILLLGLCTHLFAGQVPENEEAVVERLALLEVNWVRDELQALAKIKDTLKSLDRTAMPIAWAHAYAFLKSKQQLDNPTVTTHELRQDRRLKEDPGLQLRLLMLDIDEKIKDGLPAEEITRLYREGEVSCQETSHVMWCGRFYNHWTGYLYKTNDLSGAFRQVRKAMQLLETLPKPYRYYFTLARNNLHILFYSERQLDRAIEAAEANFKEQYQDGFLADAATECYNLVTYMLKQSPLDREKMQEILDKGLAIARETKNDFYVAALQHMQGRFLLAMKDYEASLPHFSQALDVFHKTSETIMYARAAADFARALIALHQLDKAHSILLEAKSMIGPDYGAEHLELADYLYEVMKKKGDAAAALKYLEEHFQRYKEQAQLEKKEELTKYASELGLKYEEEKNKRLERDNQIQRKELEEAEWIRLIAIVFGCMLIVMIALGVFAFNQLRKTHIADSKKNMILSNIAQGICTIERDMSIGKDYTWHINRIFKSGLKSDGHDAIEQLFGSSQLNEEQRDLIREVIRSTVNEDELAWELNSGNLPHELTYGVGESQQVLALDWAPIIEKSGLTTRVLLTFQDITFRRHLEKEIDAQKAKASQLLGIFEELSRADFQTAARLFEELGQDLFKLTQGKMEGDELRNLLRSLHTHKGEARSMGLQSLSQQIHALESGLHHPGQGPLPIEKLNELLREYRRFVQGASGNAKSTPSRSLLGIVESILPGAMTHCANNKIRFQKVLVEDAVLSWTPEISSASRQVITHALNNSLDHGFIFPRGKGKKLPDPCITITAHEDEGLIRVILEDNGGGLDLAKLQELALQKGFNPQKDQTIADVVFEDGVSTAEAVSLSSGRGVGMSAIKQICEELGGTARIAPASSAAGTRVTCTFAAHSPGFREAAG